MKICVLGDIHGRSCWTDIIAREKPDKVIFLGDYVSSHERISEETQINNLEGILEYKETNPDTTILLRGNHDEEALNYYWAECWPKTGKVVKEYMSENKDRFIADTQWVHIEDNIIFSHAGISSIWLEEQKIDFEKINTYPSSPKFGFIPECYSDESGDSKTQSCVWIRPLSLIECAYQPEKYIQVVGHTTVVKIYDTNCADETFPHIWLCDCLPRQYLVIEDGNFKVENFEI